MEKTVLWAAQKNQHGDAEEFTKDMDTAIVLKWLVYRRELVPLPHNQPENPWDSEALPWQKKGTCLCSNIGHKSPPAAAAWAPPPHSLKCLPEREVLLPPDGNRIRGRSLLTQKANDHELAEL